MVGKPAFACPLPDAGHMPQTMQALVAVWSLHRLADNLFLMVYISTPNGQLDNRSVAKSAIQRSIPQLFACRRQVAVQNKKLQTPINRGLQQMGLRTLSIQPCRGRYHPPLQKLQCTQPRFVLEQ